jgi:hypothetical protein
MPLYRSLLTLCLCIGLASAAPRTSNAVGLHEFHSSICQIDYNETNKTLEIAVSFFLDDIENALLKAYGDTLHLDTTMNEQTDQALANYLQQNLQFKVNNKPQKWQWIGKEITPNELWCYVEISKVRKVPQSLWVKNTLLLELFKDQVNWVQLAIKDKKKSVALQLGNTTGVLTCD